MVIVDIHLYSDMVHAAIFFLSEYLIMLPSNCLSRVLELFPSVIQLTRKWLWLTSPFAPTWCWCIYMPLYFVTDILIQVARSFPNE